MNRGLISPVRVFGRDAVKKTKRIVWLLMMAVLLSACSPAGVDGEIPASPVPKNTAPIATPLPTAEPTPTPLPAPKITEPWYQQRRAEMAEHLRRFRAGITEEQIEKILFEREIDPEKPMIALTFDDGPVAAVTNGVLDILEEYNARATFFICGYRLNREENAACLERMLTQGCEIGNHTFEHDYLTELGKDSRRASIRKTNEKIARVTGGYTARSLRPPGGKTSGYICSDAKKLDMAVVLWSQSGNVHLTDPAAIAENVQKQAVDGRTLRHGDIVLLHDTKEHMVEAVRLMVPALLEQGYQLVTVQELLNLSQPGFTAGMQYRSMENYR